MGPSKSSLDARNGPASTVLERVGNVGCRGGTLLQASLQPLDALAVAHTALGLGPLILGAIDALITGITQTLQCVLQIDLAIAKRSAFVILAGAETVLEVCVQRVRRHHLVEPIARGDVMTEPAIVHCVEV